MTLALDRLCGIADEGAAAAADQIRLHQSLGLPGLELRGVSGLLLHELTEEAFGELARLLEESGLAIPAVCTPIGGWATTIATPIDEELGLLQIYARRARALGCDRLRVMSYPNDGRSEEAWRGEALSKMRALVAAGASAGVSLLHENCSGWASQHADATIAMLETIDDEHLQLLFDIGNDAADGRDGYTFLERVLPFVAHVHVKDVVLDGGEARFVLPGDGAARVADSLALLHRSSYAGWVSIEPHTAHVVHTGATADDETLAAHYASAAGRVRELVERITG